VNWFQAQLQDNAAARDWLATAPPLPGIAQVRRRGLAAEQPGTVGHRKPRE